MTQEGIYELLRALANVEEMDGPERGPWQVEAEGTVRGIRYEDGYITLFSDTGLSHIETTLPFLPEDMTQALSIFERVRDAHVVQLIERLREVQARVVDPARGLPN